MGVLCMGRMRKCDIKESINELMRKEKITKKEAIRRLREAGY